MFDWRQRDKHRNKRQRNFIKLEKIVRGMQSSLLFKHINANTKNYPYMQE